eukprot:CAMPEP_0185589136 /NCGR_PEP_ID=MMETSP0434-20130131/55741_1 /TAXON_ID=626734 ORGANISM="Favella taraikaensis, Strain Fe Narragansett Bay" /NCGR_SAMPLE_ID=MMETSP0434 /ASSEMBLY_ACC=CAM_ASM_000379 /LENGTH=71 /DNA_ID=CAMNT_0028212277 /DNA_START=162 /DNA_END=377 /DNA_ORIENTATION=+
MLGVMCFIMIPLSITISPGIIAITFALYIVIWLIIGPILLTSLAEMESALSQNIEVAEEFEIFRDCADPLA